VSEPVDPHGARAVSEAPFGVYVHVPFCAARCDYCAFATWTDRHHLHLAHTEATVMAIRDAVETGRQPPADSVFFGGGTPSLLAPELLLSMLGAIPRRPGAEVTVECNPDTVTPALMEAYASGGVTRVSFGVQSMAGHVLEALGRTHRADAVGVAVAAARRAGITNLNLDLIYGVAGETLEDWTATIDAVLAFDPPHVSAYALTVEAGTPLAGRSAAHPDEDLQVELYLHADRRFAAAGLANYEISNWARPGSECRHNWLYWRQGDYLGFGCAAHSHRAGRRWWNVRTPERYVEEVAKGRTGEAVAEVLDHATREAERLQLELRTRTGVAVSDLPDRGRGRIDELVEHGLLMVRAEDGPGAASARAVLTPAGRMMANAVSNALI
jgi:oxygen-independent coproporphyrinogen-3 oxidase